MQVFRALANVAGNKQNNPARPWSDRFSIPLPDRGKHLKENDVFVK